MTDKEIMAMLEKASAYDCDNCLENELPWCDRELCNVFIAKQALDLINRQRKFIRGITQMILDYTYPSFDKNGKPVNVWNPEGYDMVKRWQEEMAGADNV